MRSLIIILLMAVAMATGAQETVAPAIQYVDTAPTGTCIPPQPYKIGKNTGTRYVCKAVTAGGTGTWTADTGTSGTTANSITFNNSNSGTASGAGQIMSDPKLVSPSVAVTALGDNHLQAGSPALAGGTRLTTVSGAVSGSTTLVVADAGFFQANAGAIPGVNADCISISTVSNHVCITSINYSTNTLTLASPVTAANGDPVWLYSDSSGNVQLSGTAPNIGALGTEVALSVIGLSGRVVGVVQ